VQNHPELANLIIARMMKKIYPLMILIHQAQNQLICQNVQQDGS
jgi:hypothetical protein